MNLVFVTRCERIARFVFNVGDRMTFLIFLKLEKIILKNKERRHTSLVFSKTLPPPPKKLAASHRYSFISWSISSIAGA